MSKYVHRGTVHRLSFQHEPFGVRFWVAGLASNIRIAEDKPGKFSAHVIADVIRAIHRKFGYRVIVTVY